MSLFSIKGFSMIMLFFMIMFGIGLYSFHEGLLNMQAASEASSPVIPLSDLQRYAGTGKAVRVQAVMLNIPALQSVGGETLGMEKVVVTHHEEGGSRSSATTETDYEGMVPEWFVVGDGVNEIVVKGQEIDIILLHKRAEEYVRDNGELSPGTASLLLPQFKDLPHPANSTVAVYTINRGEAVTIVGKVVMDKGELTLQGLREGEKFMVSPLPLSKITWAARCNGVMGLLFGVLLLGVPLTAAGLGLGFFVSARRRALASV